MAGTVRFGFVRTVVIVLVAFSLVMPLIALRTSAVLAQEAQADATVRVIHASPGAPDIDVLLDGQPLVDGITSGTASEYVAITPSEHRLQVVPAGQTADAAVVDETIDAEPGRAYLVAVFGLVNDMSGAVYDVDLSEIEPGNVRVRMLNLSPDGGELDLLETGGDEWFSDVGLGDLSDYRDIAPGSYSVDLRGEDDAVLETVSELPFAEARVYDIVVLGQVADGTLEVQSLITSVSPPCAEVLGIDGAGSDACLRIVHTALDTAPIDAYVNDAQIAQDVAFGTATEYVAVPSGGGRAMRVTATGAPLEEAIIDASFDLDPGQAYEVLTTGSNDDLELTITGTDLRPVAEGQARLRVIHASPDAGDIDIGIEGQEDPLFDGIDFRAATDYIVLDAGDYPIEVRPGGDDMTVALQADATLDEGETYDLVALGRPEDRTLALLVLTAPVAIQIGDVATPEAVEADGSVAGTVESETIEDEDMEVSPTPAG